MNRFMFRILKSLNRLSSSIVSYFFNSLDVKDLLSILKSNLDNVDFIIYKLNKDNLDMLLNIDRYDLMLLCRKLDNKSIFLENDIFRNNIGACIIRLFSSLSGEELLKLVDDDFIKKIFSSNEEVIVDKYLFIYSLLSLNNYEKNRILENYNCLSYIESNVSSYCNAKICCLDDDFILSVIDYCLKYNTNKLLFLFQGMDESLISVLIFNNYERIINLKPDENFLFSLSFNLINKLIENKFFLDIYMNNLDKLNDLFYNGYVLPDFLLNNNVIINYYVSLEGSLYYKYLNNLLKANPSFALEIDMKRKKKIIKNIRDDSLDKDFLLVVSTFFHDSIYNLRVNICNMINYIFNNGFSIPIENLRFYRDILFFDELSNREKKNFLNSFGSCIDYSAVFYDDYNSVKRHSYISIRNSLLKLNKDSKFYSSYYSKKYGLDIYYLDGEAFYSIVHCTDCECSDRNMINWNLHNTIALSLIGTENIAVYKSNFVKFGFFDFNVDNVMHVSYTDSYTSGLKCTSKIQSIMNSSELLNCSIGHTEILYKENNLIKPDFIMCYDEPLDGDIYNARKFNIPILIINTKKYVIKSGVECFEGFYNDDIMLVNDGVCLSEKAMYMLSKVR